MFKLFSLPRTFEQGQFLLFLPTPFREWTLSRFWREMRREKKPLRSKWQVEKVGISSSSSSFHTLFLKVLQMEERKKTLLFAGEEKSQQDVQVPENPIN